VAAMQTLPLPFRGLPGLEVITFAALLSSMRDLRLYLKRRLTTTFSD